MGTRATTTFLPTPNCYDLYFREGGKGTRRETQKERISTGEEGAIDKEISGKRL